MTSTTIRSPIQINGLYKAGVIHRGPWRNFEAVEFATLEWVDRFNNRRRDSNEMASGKPSAVHSP